MAAAGDIINGFTLVRQLGAGGMGETWEAVRHVGSDFEQRVAIKVVHKRALESAEGLALFWREASLAASLRHPNIAAVLDVDERAGSIVCELVDGADLRAVLRVSPGLRLRPALLVYMLGQIARGLSHAHRRLLHGQLSPVVHRDMSPANVVVDYDGNLKIVDFGIAKAIASADISETIKGKLSYMAPEQAMATRIDGRADQYALGVIAYEAASGIRPNDGMHDGETLANILSGKRLPVLTRVPYMPVELAEVIERMLSVQPEQRFASMDAVIGALDPFTPPMSIHREFASLVQRAHPVQTIVRFNGRYISQPVAVEPREATPVSSPSAKYGLGTPRTLSVLEPVNAHAVTASADSPPRTGTLVRQPIGRTPPAVPARALGELSSRRAARARVGRQAWMAAAGAAVLGISSWAVVSSDGRGPNPPAAERGDPSAPAPAAPMSAEGPKPTPRPSNSLAPLVPPHPAPSSPPTAGTQRTDGALAPNGTRAPPSAAETPPPQTAPKGPPVRRAGARSGNATAAESSAVPPARDPLDAVGPGRTESSKPAEPERAERDGAARTATGSKAASATVRVKVFPWGRVWVDGKLRGSVPPILELTLSPGAHEIAVGHEQPVESRSVTLDAAAIQLVSFDLEGR